jgi:hypothetical protein
MSNSNSDLELDNFDIDDNELSLEDIKKTADAKRHKILKRNIKKPTPIKPRIIPKVSNVSKSSKDIKTTNIINSDNDILNQLKELLLNQNEILNNLNIKKTRKPRVKKPVVERKTLDLTITDTDIKNIIENNNNDKNNNNIDNKNKTETNTDEKLQAFLNAFKKY